MEKLQGGYTLETGDNAFPLSTDSIALAGFVRMPRDANILDLGSGAGTLGTLLCARDATCRVTGVEIDESAHRAALNNIASNGLTDRHRSICADIRCIPSLFPAGSFHVCVSNPPYFTGGRQSKRTPTARQALLCPMDTLFSAAAHALRYGGDFFLVHKPDSLAQLCACGKDHQLEAKRLMLLRHRTDSAVSLILMQFRKGAKPGLCWEENSLFYPGGTPTDYYRALYHIQEGS